MALGSNSQEGQMEDSLKTLAENGYSREQKQV